VAKPFGNARFGTGFGRELVFERIGVESQTHQLLAEAIMEFLTDAGLFPVTNLQELTFPFRQARRGFPVPIRFRLPL
jgi:hypothetical protein